MISSKPPIRKCVYCHNNPATHRVRFAGRGMFYSCCYHCAVKYATRSDDVIRKMEREEL